MKTKKLLAFVLTFAIILTQFTVLSSVFASASSTEYPNTATFSWGINTHSEIHNGYRANHLDEQVYLAAKTGVKMLRIDVDKETGFKYYDKFVSLCNAYGIKVLMAITSYVDVADANGAKVLIKELASRYDGNNGKGKVDYFQFKNEVDVLTFNQSSASFHGMVTADYDTSALSNYVTLFKKMQEGLDESTSDAKSVINFSWLHYGFLDYLITNGVSFDTIGLDWYSNMESEIKDEAYSFNNIGEYLSFLMNRYSTYDFLLTEIGQVTSSQDDISDISNWDALLSIIDDVYEVSLTNSKLKGAFIYELLDAPATGTYYGLINASNDGTIGTKKAIYNKVTELFGGLNTNCINSESLNYAPYGDVYTAPSDAVENGYAKTVTLFDSSFIHHYGSQFKWFQDRLIKTGMPSVDFSTSDYIEADVFIEDYDSLISNMNGAGATPCRLELRLSSNESNANLNAYYAVLSNYISKSGWNHVRIPKGDFVTVGSGGHIDWTCVKSFMVKFGFNPDVSTGELFNDFFAIANIYGTNLSKPTDTFDNGYKVNKLYDNIKKTTFGATFGTLDSNMVVANLTSTDATSAFSVEADVYIEDFETLYSLMKKESYADKTQLELLISSNATAPASNAYFVKLENYITKSGWNHISIPLSDFETKLTGAIDWSSLQSFKLRFGYNGNDSISEVSSDKIAIANVGVLVLDKPTSVLSDGYRESSTLFDNIKSTKFGSKFSTLEGQMKVENLTAVNATTASNIEADVYVEDFETLYSLMKQGSYTNKTQLEFIVSSNATAPKDNASAYIKLEDYITKSGWNHVCIPMSDFVAKAGSINWASVQSFALRFGYINVDGGISTLSNDKFAIANIKFTYPNVKVDSTHKVISTLFDSCKTAKYGAQYQGLESSFTLTNLTATDFSSADNVEFDIYVKDKNALLNGMNNAGTTATRLEFYLSSGNSRSSLSYTYSNVESFIKNDGWNHVCIKISDMTRSAGFIDWTKVNCFALRFGFNGTVANPVANQLFSVANVCATKSFVLGDVNNDGSINILDLVGLKKHIAGIKTYEIIPCDINCDGDVNADDMTLLIDTILGK